MNNFQGRYIIRHPWEGAVECENPVRGIWEGPPGGAGPSTATNTAFVPRGKIQLAGLVSQDIPELSIRAGELAEKPEKAEKASKPLMDRGAEEDEPPEPACAAAPGASGLVAALASLLAFARRRRE